MDEAGTRMCASPSLIVVYSLPSWKMFCPAAGVAVISRTLCAEDVDAILKVVVVCA